MRLWNYEEKSKANGKFMDSQFEQIWILHKNCIKGNIFINNFDRIFIQLFKNFKKYKIKFQ